ncbi:MAG: hypothetical protein DMF85_06340 [Acidobacteria bacterium]|nr:MAG: hypothetical protein DMF85_06340 [Acidobacteriota bacterium]
MLSFVTIALCATLNVARAAPLSAAAALEAPDRHVRTLDRRVHWLIAQGVSHSRTFASLVTEITSSDVIVYVQEARDLPTGLSGRLFLLPTSNDQRYLRIQVRLDGLSPRDAIALMAHELQHAVEVARAPDVRDAATMARLYERIGDRGLGAHWYETQAARRAGRQVRSELSG